MIVCFVDWYLSGEQAMTFSATMFWHCKCGAEVHVFMDCKKDQDRRAPLPVQCWSCHAMLGQVPAVRVFAAATAQEALTAALDASSLSVELAV